MATTEDTGLSLSDWVGIGGLVLTFLGIPLGLIGAHFHSAVRKPEARAKLIERLSTTGARDAYHERLARLLTWLDQRIGPPPFARVDPRGRRIFGVSSLGVCITLALAYSIGSWLAGWVAGAPGALGQVTLLESHWTPAWAPEWLPRLLVALLVVGIGGFIWWYFRTAGTWFERQGGRLSERFGWRTRFGWRAVGDAVLRFFAVALAFVLAFSAALAFALALPLVFAFAVAFPGPGASSFAFAGAKAGAFAPAVAFPQARHFGVALLAPPRSARPARVSPTT